jgi:hypothetical protein
MSPNPYNPPQAAYGVAEISANRTPFLLAAAGAWLASAYWAVLTLLIALRVTAGAGSATSLVLPFILIGLYAVRGYQLYKGDRRAAARILWLHGVGAVVAVFQAMSGMLVVMQVIKVAIHVFGGVTALLALRALARTR